MHTNSDYDSEDDDGYFLTPVLNYNITDKIKEANKMLFEEEQLQNLPDCCDNNNNNVEMAKNNNRCVTFAQDLVSFAPNANKLNNNKKAAVEVEEEEQENEKLLHIIEIAQEIDSKMSLKSEEQQQQAQNLHNLQDNKNKSLLTRDPPYHTTTTTSELKQPQQQLSIELEPLCEEEVEEHLELPEELSQAAKTTTQLNVVVAMTHVDDVKEEQEEEEEESDNLSMQVGLIARNAIKQEASSAVQPQQQKTTTTMKTNKKTYKQNGNNIKFNYRICCEYARSQQQQQQQQPIKSNLPQYKGFISEYGLSRQERERLLQNNKRQERSLLEQEMRAQEDMFNRMTANEQAFCTWLRNKCRKLPNRTRNMFDFNSNKRNKF